MKRTLLSLVLVALYGCDGSTVVGLTTKTPVTEPEPETPGVVETPTGGPEAPDACKGISVVASPTALRRLSVEEQRSTFRDILKDTTLAPDLDPITGPVITESEVEKLNVAAEAMIARGGHLAYVPAGCDTAGAYNSTCADGFIANFGQMAFRRPLTDGEKAWLKNDVYEPLRANTRQLSPAATFREALGVVAQTVLQSGQLLYVAEQGVADAALPAGVKRLTGYERATRLSYLLWKTTPDATLLAAAGAGKLDTADGLRTEAARLLASPRSKGAVRGFLSSWLELDGNSHQASLEAAPKSATLFPFDSPALRSAMREEVLALFEQTFNAPGGSFKTLMTSPRAYVNRSLGQLYGVASPPANDSTYAWVDLNPQQRAGLFSRAAFLALYAPQEQKSPIRRGVFLFKQALCRPLGSPPANVNNTPYPVTDKPLTVRQQTDARTSAASCQGCHRSINSLGYLLEGYDAMGRFQTTEKGTLNGTPYELPIDSAAEPLGTDFDGPVAGPVELAQKLGDSGMAHDCVASTWFKQATSRPLTTADACSLQRLMQRFRQSDDLKDLLLSLASDDSALFIQETP